MRYVLLFVWNHPMTGELISRLAEDDDGTAYFQSPEEAMQSASPHFPGDALVICLDTLEIAEI